MHMAISHPLLAASLNLKSSSAICIPLLRNAGSVLAPKHPPIPLSIATAAPPAGSPPTVASKHSTPPRPPIVLMMSINSSVTGTSSENPRETVSLHSRDSSRPTFLTSTPSGNFTSALSPSPNARKHTSENSITQYPRSPSSSINDACASGHTSIFTTEPRLKKNSSTLSMSAAVTGPSSPIATACEIGESTPVNVTSPPATFIIAAATFPGSTFLTHSSAALASAYSNLLTNPISINRTCSPFIRATLYLTPPPHPLQKPRILALYMSTSLLKSHIRHDSPDFSKNHRAMIDRLTEIKNEEEKIREGGGAKAIESQHKKGRMTARERIAALVDPQTEFFELGLYAAYQMYEEWGSAPAAGVVTGLGRVSRRQVMIIANDATVKAGAFFPMTAKKVIRAQNIAIENHIPTIYLVDSAGVFLPLQEDVFPDTDDFGRVFRNNAVMSAQGIPQLTAIMGMCVAGGAYLPVMCDHILMTEGSGLFLAGPALVQAAIGQKTSAEELGGAKVHAQISGTVDFREPDDKSCLARIRALVDKTGRNPLIVFNKKEAEPPAYPMEEIYGIFYGGPTAQYDVREIIARV